MLKLPAFSHHQRSGESATVFQDDAQFWRFYVIPGFPRVRLTTAGDPSFLLIKYAFSDAARADDPDLPTGGGYMVFDAELSISDEFKAEIIDELQGHVDSEYERLRNAPPSAARELTAQAVMNDRLNPVWAGAGHHGGVREREERGISTTIELPPAGQTIELPPASPDVVIGEPLWKRGTVTMNAPQAPALVNASLSQRPASMLGNNAASFSLDLTPDGATFMERTLVGDGGAGATDLSPIQVSYELTMQVKLPPARMYLHFDSGRVYHALQELFHEHDSSGCDDDYFTSETMMSAARESGLIDLKIDMGGVDDPDLQQLLTQQAMNQATELMSKMFADVERAPLEEWADEDVQESGREIYRLKRVTEIEITDFTQRMEITPTIEWTIAPNGTLATFFRDRTDMDGFVRVVDLDDDFFKTLGLTIRVFANFDTALISFVDVQVEYRHGGETKTDTFTFTPTENQPQTWDPSLIDGKREYRYRWRVRFDDQESPDYSPWQTETTRDLNIAVESPGRFDVTVTGVGLDFDNVLDAVLVHLRYGDPANDIPTEQHSLVLTAESRTGQWIRELHGPYEQPVDTRIVYFLKNGSTVETQWASTEGPTSNVVVTRPGVDVLDLTLLPAGTGWETAIQAVASVRYVDGDYHRDEQFRLASQEEFREWAVLLLDPAKRTIEYKVTATFRNGDVQDTDWHESEGDQTLPVVVEGPPRLSVKVSGQIVDFAGTPTIKVDLEYDDPGGTSDSTSVVLTGPEAVETWSIPIRADGPKGYRYRVTYFPLDGDQFEGPWTDATSDLLLVPRHEIDKVGAKFIPTMLSFAVTPAVEVTLTYDDPARGVREVMSLVFTEAAPQEWFLRVPEGAPKSFTMAITYFYADGEQATRDAVQLEKPAVIIPPAPALATPATPPTPPTPVDPADPPVDPTPVEG